MIEVIDRAGVARIAKWSNGKNKVSVPNIAFHDSSLFPAPSYAELTIHREEDDLQLRSPGLADPIAKLRREIVQPLSQLRGTEHVPKLGEGYAVVKAGSKVPQEMKDAVDLFVLENAFEMRRDARTFVDSIASLRNEIGYGKLIYAPGIMDPSNLALLIYMGMDLVDSSLILLQSSRGKVLLPEGSLSSEEAKWLVGRDPEETTRFNLDVAWKELQLVRHMIKIGRLRELVETRSNATPWAVAALRIFDLEHYNIQERYTSVVGPSFYCNSKQSLFRPDVWRYRKRIMERYTAAKHKKVLLLIPCSAKKPYSTSKSHRILTEVLDSVPNSAVVQELIITSPLGAVPREIEMFYPAAQYDIPVTGNWDREEVAMVQEMVRKVASRGFEKVICHLGVESEFVKPVVDCVDTSPEGTTSGRSLGLLKEELEKACASVEKVPRAIDRAETMRSAAIFQFGAAGSALLDDCSIVGHVPYLKIMKGNTQRGMLTPDRGMISLTMEGGEALLGGRVNVVEIGDFDLTGNLFAVGVEKADPLIRAGDEVLIVRKGELEGVGVAAMSGPEMEAVRRGEAVRVRHKRKR